MPKPLKPGVTVKSFVFGRFIAYSTLFVTIDVVEVCTSITFHVYDAPRVSPATIVIMVALSVQTVLGSDGA